MLATSPPRTSGQSALRRINTRTVLHALRESLAPVRATDLAKHTGLTRATVITILRELVQAGVALEGPSELHGGRPSPTYSIDGTAFPVIGVDLGAERVAVRLAGIDDTRLGAAQSPLHTRERAAVLGLEQVVLTGASSRSPAAAAALESALRGRGLAGVACLPSPAGEDSVVDGAVVAAADLA